jgi:hypothetical protein
MKFAKSLTTVFAVAIAAVSMLLSGCASMEAHQKESLMSAAGFRTRTPTTPKQIAIFQSLKPYKMHRAVVKGQVLYAYADPSKDMIYVGTQKEYNAYKALNLQQNIAEEQEMTASMNEEAAMDWGDWGPWGFWY